MPDILVYAQIGSEGVNDVSLQCLAKAKEIAGGGKIAAIAMGSAVADKAGDLAAHGAETVYVAEDAALEQYLTTPYKNVIKPFLETNPFPVVLFPATTSGNDLAPVLAAEMDAACVIDGSDVLEAGGKITVRRLEFDRKVHSDYAATGDAPLFVTLKDGVAEVGEPDASKQADVQTVDASAASIATASKVLNRDVTEKTVNLKDATIIVGAGAGVGTEENFQKIRDLAHALNAEIGATRAVVDAGWVPADHQIGQTGATVKPDVYIACGVSGAVQHWVGMSEAKWIIAVNIDANAPIMKRAHYRVNGDLNEVIPKLVTLLS